MFSWLWSPNRPPRGEVPVFVEVLQGQRVKHGTPAVLQARLTGYPPPQIVWYQGSKEIPNSSDFKQEYDDTDGKIKLSIAEVFVDDQGPYRAVAINEHGKDETTAFVGLEDIEVLEKSELRQAPRVTLPLKANVITAHASVDLVTQFEAFPPPTVKWYKQGKEIKPSAEFHIDNRDNESRLHVEEVYEDDSGDYEVRIFNDAGEARTAASLVVLKPEEKVQLVPPQFTKPLTPQIVPEGEVAVLDVEVKANPDALFSWYRHGVKIMNDEELEVSITSEENKSRLVIGEVFEDDSGDYSVTAENEVGRASSTATLLVEGEGAQDAIAPEFNPPLTAVRVMDGQQVRFSCRVTGTPTPQILWFHSGRPIGHHKEVKALHSQDGKVGLVISEVFPEDEGDYTCIARNKAGEARTTATLSVEAYEYQPDSEIATVTSISEKTIISGSVTEDETLDIEKDSSSSDSDLSDIGSAPEFTENLPTTVNVDEGKPIRLLAKVSGYPRPSITWHLDGETVKVGESLTLENYEDGTVSLSLPAASVEQCGEYTCEAQNRNGVATSVTQLVVLPHEHSEATSSAYRKPDWVVRMEELKSTIQAEHTEPQFVQELVDGIVREMENYVFTVTFAGNPKPELSWYHDNLLIHQHQSYQMRVRGDKAFLSVIECSPKHKGEYVCRAANSAGEAITRAILDVTELTYEEKLTVANERYAALSIQHAAEHMKVKERERNEKQKVVHKEAMERMREDRSKRNIETERELEDAKTTTWKSQRRVSEAIKPRPAPPEPKTPKEHRIAQVYTNWKAPVALEESYPEIEPDEFSPNQIPGVKCFVKVSDTSIRGEEVVNEIAPRFFEDEQVITELARVHTLLRNSVRVNEIWSMFRVGEFPALQQPSIQTALVKICEYIGHQRNVSLVLAEETKVQAAQHPVGLKAFLRMLKHANNVKHDVLFKEVIPKEMGKWSTTTQELEKVSQMLNQGILCEEIIASCEAGHLPTLKKPETQQPLVNIVEKQGHSVMVAQVLVEEAYRDAKDGLPKVDVAAISSVDSLKTASTSEVVVREDTQVNVASTITIEAVSTQDVHVGDLLRAIATYVAEEEHENSMHLVEGERVYVLESINSDWWFVEKHLTKERGYVPAKLLSVDVNYTLYVKKKLEEKINKLPVFEKLKKGQKGEAPKITRILESQTVVDGQEVQFVVKVEGSPRPNITWFRQTAIIKPSEEFQIFYAEDNTATLLVKEVFPEDAGLFTCVVKNLAGYAVSEAELIVDGPMSDHGSETMLTSRRSLSRDSSVCDTMEGIPPTFATKSITKTCEENANFEVDVRLVAIPEPEIAWRKEGLVLHDSNRIRIVRQKDVHAYRSILLIKGTKKEDEGEYEVYCKNREGEAKCHIFLRITAPEPPLFEEKFSDTTVEEDGTIRLVARIRGVPAPDISWSRNGKKIKLEKNVVARFEEEIAVLEVQHASTSVDAGKYVCTATNKVGKASHSATVTVGSDVVTFKRGLESCIVEENAEAILECRTSREKEVKWWKGKTQIKASERILIEHEGLTHRIVIHSSAVSDTGKYKVTFDDQSTWCNFTVKPLEEFVQKLQDLEVLEKEEAVLQVEVSTEKAVVSWHKDGEEIATNDRVKIISEGKIRRVWISSSDLHDEGEYTCVLGDLETTCEVSVRELPAEIVKDMTDQTVNKAEKASFAVELSKGDAVVTWYKDGNEIRISDHYQLSIEGKIQRLMIYNCQTDDIGVYRAIVGQTESSARLEVEAQAEGDFIKKLPSQMDVISRTDAEFTVEISKADRDVKWYRNGEEVFASERFIIEKSKTRRTLIVKNVTIDDTAEYTCVLGSLKTSCKMTVLVLESAPQIDRSSIQVEFVVIKGTDVTFTVPFKATPQPTGVWTHKGKEIKSTKRLLPSISENVASFTIYQVENVDCGEYTLKLVNNCGDVSIDFILKILDKPSKPGTPETLRVTNNSVTIHWKAPEDDGGRVITNYIIEYTFRKVVKWVVYNASETIRETTHTVTSLTTNEEYSFRVAAVNEVGTSEYSGQSEFVKVAEPIKPEAPMVKEVIAPVITGLRQSVVLRCVITGTPVPTITWTQDDKVITSNITYEDFTATLTISETNSSTSGLYTCRAVNSAGTAETSATVVIQEAPKFEFDEKCQAQRLFVGDRWHIPIKVTGFPQPKISWTCNDQSIQNFPRVVIHIEECDGLTDIAIQSLAREDTAVFALTAQNSAGKATIGFNLRVDEEEIVVKEVEKERPAAPAGPLEITDITTFSARLTWRPSPHDGGSEITSYYIEKLEKGQKQWQKVAEVEANIFTYVVENLNEGREYFFRVFALNAIGLSEALEASETIFIKSPFNPPGPPLGPFDVTDMTESSLVLHWDEPLEDGGSPITGYTVERRTAMKKAWQKIGQTAGDVTHFECTSLKKGYTYFFRVCAVNVAGQGPPLQPDEAITAGKKLSVPSKPNGLNVIDVTSKTVTLGWSPPSTTGGADLIGYVIEKRLTESSSATWERVETVDSSVTLYCVENLIEKSEYEFRVFAENPVGLSEEAAVTEYVQLKTHATPPSPPTAPLEARPTGPTSLMIEWGAPESDGGSPLLGYIIAIRDIKRTMWIEVGQVDANFTRLHIKEVQEEHEYNVRVFARNEIGASDPLQTEDPVKIIRPDDFQEMPHEDAAPSLSYSTTETLSWMREAGVDADIYSYARGRLLNRDEYFFKVWHQTQQIREEESEDK